MLGEVCVARWWTILLVVVVRGRLRGGDGRGTKQLLNNVVVVVAVGAVVVIFIRGRQGIGHLKRVAVWTGSSRVSSRSGWSLLATPKIALL